MAVLTPETKEIRRSSNIKKPTVDQPRERIIAEEEEKIKVETVETQQTQKSQNQEFEQDEIKIEDVRDFATQVSAARFPTVRGRRAQQVIETLSHRLAQYQHELDEPSLSENLNQDNPNLSAEERAKLEDKRKKRQEKIDKIAHEVFIIACASNLEMAKTMEFCQKNNLAKDINKFGENGLNPLSAAMIAGKSAEDLQQLKNNGADPNAKDQFGRSAQDVANLVSNYEKLQDERNNMQDEDGRGIGGRSISMQRRQSLVSRRKKSETSISEEGELGEDAWARSQLIDYLDSLKERKGKKEKGGKSSVSFGSGDIAGLGEAEAEFLRNAGIDPTDPNALNKALFYSVKSGNATMPMLLIKLGADVNYRENGMTILGAAMVNANEAMLPILTYLSSPETRRTTLETNRQFIDRFEGSIESIRTMVQTMGQEDFNERQAKQEVDEKIQVLLKTEELQRISKSLEEQRYIDQSELEAKKKDEEEKKQKEKEDEEEGQSNNGGIVLNPFEVFEDAAVLALGAAVFVKSVTDLSTGKQIYERESDDRENDGFSFVDLVTTRNKSKTSDQSH